MSTNLSKIKRDKMLDLINELKEELKGDQDKLTALLDIENEIREKKYGLVWEEHEEAVDKELETKIPVFKEDKDREIKLGDEKVNFILEGDNLHSLYLLEKTHRGKIDVIYIDPPYNTGNNDFKYGDKMVGEDDGYRHSKWLSFMGRRLEIARELLTEEGVIFISIDDKEQAPLKMLCDDILGNQNFVTNMIWKSRSSLQYSEPLICSQTEYVLVYVRNKNVWNIKTKYFNRIKKEHDAGSYKNLDNDINGPWLSSGIIRDDGRKKYTVTSPTGIKHTEAWLYTEDNFKQLELEGRIWWGKDGSAKPRKKSYLKDFEGSVSSNLLMDEFAISEKNEGEYKKKKLFTIGTTESGTTVVKDIFGDKIFDYPKPTTLIKYLVNLHPNKNTFILDFFAGSGTTGQAVLELNKEDGGNRTFILCTNNEVGEDKEKEFKKKYGNKEDYPDEWLNWEEKYGIARSITYKRMKKVIEGYTTPKGKEIEGIPANLKYYKTEYIDKQNDEDDDYEVEEEILKYVVELIQLEYGIDISNKGIGLVLSDMYGNLEGEYNVTKITKDRLDEIKVLYVAEGLILPDNLVDELRDRNIDIRWVPKYYNFN